MRMLFITYGIFFALLGVGFNMNNALAEVAPFQLEFKIEPHLSGLQSELTKFNLQIRNISNLPQPFRKPRRRYFGEIHIKDNNNNKVEVDGAAGGMGLEPPTYKQDFVNLSSGEVFRIPTDILISQEKNGKIYFRWGPKMYALKKGSYHLKVQLLLDESKWFDKETRLEHQIPKIWKGTLFSNEVILQIP